uniref:Neur_chan_memb domain-containing protein n=1 Tax=Heterorhabditis bacteriophora TaxID=37862 RepID=A0A1I7X9X3_HETBA
MKFGSWTFDGTKLNLEVDENGFDTTNYMPNGEWNLQLCFRMFLLVLKFCIILPISTYRTAICSLLLFLEITIMLSICIFQNYVAEISPPTSEAVPFLGAFFALCMFTCACCIVATTLALNFHHRNCKSHEMSSIFRLIMLNWLPWLLFMHRPGYISRKATMTKGESSEDESENTEMCIISLLSSISVESYVETPRRKAADQPRFFMISSLRPLCWMSVLVPVVSVWCSLEMDLFTGAELAHHREAFSQTQRDRKLCGPHPLNAILKKIEFGQPTMESDDAVRMLARIRDNYPKLWRAYQNALTKIPHYNYCIIRYCLNGNIIPLFVIVKAQ